MAPSERELSLALEHPRGTERRTLLPYRDALNDVSVYARLSLADRDAIVRWVDIRRLLKEEHALDHDASNLADPLLPYAALRSHVIAGEHAARGRPPEADPGGELRALVEAIRRA